METKVSFNIITLKYIHINGFFLENPDIVKFNYYSIGGSYYLLRHKNNFI